MRLHQLLASLPAAQISGPADIEITSIAYDSRAVQPGGLFFAINGFHTDGRAFIPQALERGAAAVVVESPSLGAGDWGLGTRNRENSQSPIPNPQSLAAPIPRLPVTTRRRRPLRRAPALGG